jgi:hypothetical protein
VFKPGTPDKFDLGGSAVFEKKRHPTLAFSAEDKTLKGNQQCFEVSRE